MPVHGHMSIFGANLAHTDIIANRSQILTLSTRYFVYNCKPMAATVHFYLALGGGKVLLFSGAAMELS